MSGWALQVASIETNAHVWRFCKVKEKKAGIFRPCWVLSAFRPRSKNARDHHPGDEDVFLHPSEQKSFAGDPVSLETPDRGTQLRSGERAARQLTDQIRGRLRPDGLGAGSRHAAYQAQRSRKSAPAA